MTSSLRHTLVDALLAAGVPTEEEAIALADLKEPALSCDEEASHNLSFSLSPSFSTSPFFLSSGSNLY